MPSFNIVKKNDLNSSFKVSKVMADFDVGAEHVREHFIGKIDYPDKWQIGLIVGGSGTGDSDIMMTDTINPLKSKFKGFHKTFKQDDLGLSLSSFLLN
ncbi:TPA: hypothetical protein ACP06P_001161 [Streptococcus pyogenes]